MAQPFTELNPNSSTAESQTPSFTSASKGRIGDTSVAELFGGVATGIDQAVKGVTNYIKQDVKDILAVAVDNIQRDFGVGAAGAIENDIANQKQPLPGEVQRSMGDLNKLNQAYQDGSLRASSYHARLHSVVAQMRSRYPGFREEIDQSISQLTGSIPANRLVDELRNEAMKAGGQANEEAKHKRNIIENLVKEGKLTPDWIGKAANGQIDYANDYNKIIANAGFMAYQKGEIENRKASYAVAEAAGKHDRNESMRIAQKELFDNVDNVLMAASGDGKGFKQLLDAAEQGIKTDGILSPKQHEELLNSYRGLKTKLAAGYDDFIQRKDPRTGFSYAATMDPEDVKKLRSQFMDRLQSTEDQLNNKQFGILNHTRSMIDLKQTNVEASIMANESVATVSALNKVIGPQLTDAILVRTGPLFKDLLDVNKSAATMAIARLANPTMMRNSLDSELKGISPTGNVADDSKTKRAVIDFSISTITDPNVDPKVKATMIDKLFGPNNKDLMKSIKEAKGSDGTEASFNSQELFNKLTAPEVTNAIKNTPGFAYEKYKSWVNDSFVSLNNRWFNDVKDVIVSDRTSTIAYDPKSLSFGVVAKEGRPGFAPSPGSQSVANAVTDASDTLAKVAGVSTANNAVAKLNANMLPMIRLWKDEGKDPNEEIGKILQVTGVNFKAPQQANNMESLFKGIADAYTTANEKYLKDSAKFKGQSSNSPAQKLTQEEVSLYTSNLLDQVQNAKPKGFTIGNRESTNVEDASAAPKFTFGQLDETQGNINDGYYKYIEDKYKNDKRGMGEIMKEILSNLKPTS